jgi:uncharacterized membrane protein (UPF0136 family)
MQKYLAFFTLLQHLAPYYKTWSKVSLDAGTLFAKRVTVAAPILNEH